MASQTDLMAAGIPAVTAKMLGQVTITGQAGAGTTQATALLINGSAAFSTVGVNSGAILATASGNNVTTVYNGGANTLTVYPAVGESFYGLSANTGVPCVVGKTVTFTPTGIAWMVNFSA